MAKKESEKATEPATTDSADQKSGKEPEKAAEKTSSSKFLTKANWTPDIVASLLAANMGMVLGGILAFTLLFIPGTAVQVFICLILFLVAWSFAHMCYHMELEDGRYYQQGYFFLIPFIFSFLPTAILFQVGINVVNGKLVDAIGSQTVMGVPLSVVGISDLLPSFTSYATATSIGVMTIIYTIIVLIPFTITGARHHWLKWWHFIPAVFIIILGALIMTGGIALSTLL